MEKKREKKKKKKAKLPTAVSLIPRGRSLPFFSPFSSLPLKAAPAQLSQTATENPGGLAGHVPPLP